MTDKPLVSVIVLTYNQKPTVGRTLDSILAQQCGFSFEIVVGEDASADGTRAVCEAYVEKYPDIVRLLPQAPNKGLLRNFADCIADCRGQYIGVCAGDDWWHNPNKLQLQVDYMQHHPQCVLCYTNYDIYKTAKNELVNNALPQASLDPSGMVDKLLRGFFLPPLTAMYRAELVQSIGFDRYIERGYMAEDLPMYLDLARHGEFACLDVSTATYTAEAGSLSHFRDAAKMERFLLNIKQIKLDFLALYSNNAAVSAQQLDELYDKLIFRSAFALCDRQMALNYGAKCLSLSLFERAQYRVCRCRMLWQLYKRYRNR